MRTIPAVKQSCVEGFCEDQIAEIQKAREEANKAYSEVLAFAVNRWNEHAVDKKDVSKLVALLNNARDLCVAGRQKADNALLEMQSLIENEDIDEELLTEEEFGALDELYCIGHENYREFTDMVLRLDTVQDSTSYSKPVPERIRRRLGLRRKDVIPPDIKDFNTKTEFSYTKDELKDLIEVLEKNFEEKGRLSVCANSLLYELMSQYEKEAENPITYQ